MISMLCVTTFDYRKARRSHRPDLALGALLARGTVFAIGTRRALLARISGFAGLCEFRLERNITNRQGYLRVGLEDRSRLLV